MNDDCSNKHRNQDVLYFVDGDASCLLYLLQIEGLQIDLE